MQQLSHSGRQICSVSRKPVQGQAENSSPQHRLSFKQQYYNGSGPNRWLQTARERERGGKKEKSITIPWGPLLLTSTAPISLQFFLATQEPGKTRRKSLPSWRQKERNQRGWKTWTSRPGPARDKHSSLIFDMHMWETDAGDTCSALTRTQQSWHWPKPDSCRLKHVFNGFHYNILVFKSKASDLNQSENLNLDWDHGEQKKKKKAALQITSICPTFCILYIVSPFHLIPNDPKICPHCEQGLSKQPQHNIFHCQVKVAWQRWPDVHLWLDTMMAVFKRNEKWTRSHLITEHRNDFAGIMNAPLN